MTSESASTDDGTGQGPSGVDGPLWTSHAARYALGQELGRGATGTVYAARDLNLERDIAVKVLNDEGTKPDSERRADFIREARVTAALEHPGIAPVYDLDHSTSGAVYLAMRRIRGISLGEALSRQHSGDQQPAIADVSRVVTVFLKLCDALACAHARGIAHRDLKPDNIMLGDFGEVVLVDWGAASPSDVGEPAQRFIVGTPAFMSPEQARGEPGDALSDVYGAGATLFYVLLGRCPTWSDDEELFWTRKQSGDLDQPTVSERQRVPRHLLAIVLKAVAAERSARYASITELAKDLHAFQAGQAVTAYRDSALEHAVRWHRAHWRGLWLGLAALMICGVAAGVVVGERLKEIARWGRPVPLPLSAEPRDDEWVTVGRGRWEMRVGRMVSLGTQDNFRFLRRPVVGAVALEFEAEMLADTPPGDLSLTWIPDDPTSFTGIPGRGIFMQLGANDNSHAMIYDVSVGACLADHPFRLVPGRRYHLRFEIEGDRLAVLVDGQQILSAHTAFPCTSGWIGLYAYYPGKAFSQVRLSNKGLPERIQATAIGDALVDRGHLDDAISAYRMVEESAREPALIELARYRRGMAQAQQQHWAHAAETWSSVQDPRLRGLTTCLLIGHDIDVGDHAAALARAEVADLTDPEVRARFAIVLQRALRSVYQSTALDRWLALARRSYADEPLVREGVALALLTWNRLEDLVAGYPEQANAGGQALIALGRSEETLRRFPETPYAVPIALTELGRFDELLTRFTQSQNYCTEVLHLQDRFDDAVARQTTSHFRPLASWLLSGAYERILALPDDGTADERVLALIASGRENEAVESAMRFRRAATIMPLLHLGRWREVLAGLGEAEARQRLVVWNWALFDALDRGDAMQAQEATTALATIQRRPGWPSGWLEDGLLRPLARHLAGDGAAWDTALQSITSQGPTTQSQRLWWLAQLISRKCDEAAFRTQPATSAVEPGLILAQAIQAELAGNRTAARQAWRAYLDLPLNKRMWNILEGTPAVDRFARWRVR